MTGDPVVCTRTTVLSRPAPNPFSGTVRWVWAGMSTPVVPISVTSPCSSYTESVTVAGTLPGFDRVITLEVPRTVLPPTSHWSFVASAHADAVMPLTVSMATRCDWAPRRVSGAGTECAAGSVSPGSACSSTRVVCSSILSVDDALPMGVTSFGDAGLSPRTPNEPWHTTVEFVVPAVVTVTDGTSG